MEKGARTCDDQNIDAGTFSRAKVFQQTREEKLNFRGVLGHHGYQ
jgi:hypothetical protein